MWQGAPSSWKIESSPLNSNNPVSKVSKYFSAFKMPSMIKRGPSFSPSKNDQTTNFGEYLTAFVKNISFKESSMEILLIFYWWWLHKFESLIHRKSINFSKKSIDLSWCFLHPYNLFSFCFFVRKGFFTAENILNPLWLKAFQTELEKCL